MLPIVMLRPLSAARKPQKKMQGSLTIACGKKWVTRRKQTVRDYVENAQCHLNFAADDVAKADAIGSVPADWLEDYYKSDVNRALSYMTRATEMIRAL
ncbi:hypothetical protein ACUIG8_06120 [Raoultella ornithinolytica]|uniref:hypothetical protein n=1 Tax=Raoultella ornithinolytica TaxID=54291 RepID=UPI00403E1E0A